MTVSQILAFPGAYRDSLLLLGATRAMQDSEDVSWASAAMATPAVVDELTGRGFSPDGLAGADANALVLAVRAADDRAARQALDRGRTMLFEAGRDGEGAAGSGAAGARPDPRTVGEAARLLPEANVAVVSVPGPYAALAAHCALTAGLHVLLFSDNVPLAEEVELKERARRLGLLLWRGHRHARRRRPRVRQRGRRGPSRRGRGGGNRGAGGHDPAGPVGHRRVPGHRRRRP